MHVAITGASSGIGEGLARELARAGHKVTLIARRKDRLEALAKELGPDALALGADLGSLAKCTDWIAPAREKNGPIDVLVNNAGVQVVGSFATTDHAENERMIELDLLVPLRLTRTLLPDMIARKSGTIVDVASVAALAPTPGMACYSAAKAGLAAASEALRGELRGTGVHVVTVYPGPIHTDMAKAAEAKLGREGTLAVKLTPYGSVEKLSKLIRTAIERKRPRVIYPRSYSVTRHFPNVTRWVLDRAAPKVQEGAAQPPSGASG